MDWKSDGLKWRGMSCVHVPRGKAETVTKRSFAVVKESESPTEIMKKEVFHPDYGDSSEMKFLIHYLGPNEVEDENRELVSEDNLSTEDNTGDDTGDSEKESERADSLVSPLAWPFLTKIRRYCHRPVVICVIK